MVSGIFLLIASATVGVWAYDQSLADGLSRWKRNHLPSRGAWAHALGELGYQAISDPGNLAKALRSLPSQIDADGSIWTSPDSAWIAVYNTPDRSSPIDAYCLTCAQPTRAWEPAGTSWDGFDSVLERAQKASKKLRRPSQKRQEEPIDPREIRY